MQQLDNTARKNCYQILAALFRYPEPELVAQLQDVLVELSACLGLPIPEELRQATDFTELEVAYTGLFINRIGGAPAPPYGSVYLDKDARLMGESTLRVAEAYQREGLSLSGSDEPADFLATELEFLYFLVNEEDVTSDTAALAELRLKQVVFLRDLLQPWLTEFCRRIDDCSASHPLYRWSADALQRFCLLDLAAAQAEQS